MLPPHALRGKRDEVAAVGHAVKVKNPAHNRKQGTNGGVALHHTGQFFLGLVQALLGVPRVRVILVNVVVILVVFAVR